MPSELTQVEAGLAVVELPTDGSIEGARRAGAAHLPEWTARHAAVVLMPDVAGPTAGHATDRACDIEGIAPFATHRCVLLGPGEAPPGTTSHDDSRHLRAVGVASHMSGASVASAAGARPVESARRAGAAPVRLVAQDARRPTLRVLDGAHRLVPDVVEAEAAIAVGQTPPPRFRASVGSIARAVLGTQVGIALGAGGARGWCHAGVLAALDRAGLPIDLIAGTSMGAVVGGMWAGGTTAEAIEETAAEWRRRRWRLREWRVWRMHMASERQLDDLFVRAFGERAVNATDTPFCANAVDIERGEELLLRTGLLRHAARASMAFPGWTPPFPLDGRLLIDGAVVHPVPAQAVRDMGAAFVVSVLAVGPSPPHTLARRYPKRAYDVFSRAFELSGIAMGLARSEAASDVVIIPDLGDATMLSFERDREVIAAGRRTAEQQLPAILEAYARLKQARTR